MKYTEKSINTLEFNKIRELLASCAATEGAKAKALELEPSPYYDKVAELQKKTSDAKYLAGVKGQPSFGSITDTREICDRADKGAVLTPLELLMIANVLRTTRSLIDYIKVDKKRDTVLDEIFDRLSPNKFLEDKITRSIIAEDMISDEASSELGDIRRKIRQANNRVKETLQGFITSSKYSKYLQENIVTMRDGRYVIPVRSEYRSEIKGLIHDTSASGATVFIEPMSVVDANNELRMLETKEQHEIDRILAELSAAVADFSRQIALNCSNIDEIAFYFACGELSFRMDASEAEINRGRTVVLNRARHPLLDPEKVVPISVSLGEGFGTLVITGPNTGGKTVTLKTIGLLSLMAQSGLHIPVGSGSSLCLFDEILVDIGDEQSIEQSLSTFSSHMTNIVFILGVMSDKSLVLVDELGAGTDPVEGAALAVSILEEVRAAGALCASTTHYSELKTYALETDGVQNASCEFDVKTLKPTYRLIIGTPGKSNAFEISKKLGIPEQIIDRAGALISKENRRFEEVIANLEESRLEMEREKESAAREKREFEAYKAEKEAEIKKLLDDAKNENRLAHEKAGQMVESARASSEFIFAELDKLRRKRDSEKLADELEEARKNVKNHLNESSVKFDPVEKKDNSAYRLPRPLKKGDEVLLVTIGAHGTVLSVSEKDKTAEIQAGLIKTRVKIKDLRLVEEQTAVIGKDNKKQSPGVYSADVSRDFKMELDLRGQNGEEAWMLVDKYLDDAKLAGMESVRLIHGKGTGALKNALWKFLRTDPRVDSFRLGQYGEGDIGVTVVTVK